MDINFAYTYVLICADSNMYIGSTDSLERRIAEHIDGKCQDTCKRLPVKLVYYEACRSLEAARQRERQLKTGFGRGYLRKRIAHEFGPACPPACE